MRGLGLGRWLVEEAVAYCREVGFDRIFLWTVEGLDRARSVYTSLGFTVTETKGNKDWRADGDDADDASGTREVRYDLVLGAR